MRSMTKLQAIVLITVPLLLGLAGCAPIEGDITEDQLSRPMSQPSPAGMEEIAGTPSPRASPEPPTKGLDAESYRPKEQPSSTPLASLAAEDLAQRLGIDVGPIVIMDIREIVLPGPDFGCPGGPRVAEVEGVDGTARGQEIVLSVAGREYVYRAHGSQVVLCRPPAPFEDLSLPPDLGLASEAVLSAVDDLSSALELDLESVEVLSVEAVEWPDSSLGCPAPEMMYAQVVTPGYRILLKAGDQTFEYHSDEKQAHLCER